MKISDQISLAELSLNDDAALSIRLYIQSFLFFQYSWLYFFYYLRTAQRPKQKDNRKKNRYNKTVLYG